MVFHTGWGVGGVGGMPPSIAIYSTLDGRGGGEVAQAEKSTKYCSAIYSIFLHSLNLARHVTFWCYVNNMSGMFGAEIFLSVLRRDLGEI